jgi:hypothetical protein
MSICPGCGAVAVPGALLCTQCCTPLVSSAVASNTPSVIPAMASAPASSHASCLVLVENGVPGTRVIDLPQGDFSLLLGRHDLQSSPPLVVDVDLTAFCGLIELPGGGRGYSVSRRHVSIARTSGALSITALSGGKTCVRSPGASVYDDLAAGASARLDVGARVVLGAQNPLIMEVT